MPVRLVSLCLVLLALSPVAHADQPIDPKAGGKGRIERHEFPSELGAYPYIVYLPPGHSPKQPLPLVVVVHGCNTTADEQMQANLHNPLADREGFVVLYPDVNRTNIGSCWKAVASDPSSERRDSGDAAVIAGMTNSVIDRHGIDPERVYLIGMSSGAFQASAMMAAYPDLYAAIGNHAGGGYMMSAACVAAGDSGAAAPIMATAAHNEMGSRARVIPFFALVGDADPLQPCTLEAVDQYVMTNNLVASGSMTEPLALAPSAQRQGRRPGGHGWTVDEYRHPSGCLVGELWHVHGMGHYWSGGTRDPRWSEWTDWKGPNAAAASWAFFRRFRKSETALPCGSPRT